MNQLELRLLTLEQLTKEQAGRISQLSEEVKSNSDIIKSLSEKINVLEASASGTTQSKSLKPQKSEKTEKTEKSDKTEKTEKTDKTEN